MVQPGSQQLGPCSHSLAARTR